MCVIASSAAAANIKETLNKTLLKQHRRVYQRMDGGDGGQDGGGRTGEGGEREVKTRKAGAE